MGNISGSEITWWMEINVGERVRMKRADETTPYNVKKCRENMVTAD